MNSKFDILYTSCSCNKTPHAADWGENGLIVFGCCNSVVIYDPYFAEAGKILHTIHHHRGRINSVRWLKSSKHNNSSYFLATSTDGTASVWKLQDSFKKCELDQVLEGHTGIVNIGDGALINQKLEDSSLKDALIVVTASVDSTVKIWKTKEDKISCCDTFEYGSGFALDVRLTSLPSTSLMLLACALDDNKVVLYAGEPFFQNENFVKVHVLIGHEDWVRGMDFVMDAHENLYLATCSQDTHIRIWKFIKKAESGALKPYKQVSDLKPGEDIEPEEKIILMPSATGPHYFSVSLDSVLSGHSGWVYNVSWYISADGNNLSLLSSSLDKSLIVWTPGESDGIWTESVTVGAVGGGGLGFYGGCFAPNGKSFLGHSFQGSLHIWHCDVETNNWESAVTVSGHSSEVCSIVWDPQGAFLLSIGLDQTTRLHAPWVQTGKQKVTWHELARPQVHGYGMSSIAILSRYQFVSGAEEKVIRAFKAPDNFINNFRRICNISVEEDKNNINCSEEVPTGAAVPSLGLSNKAVYQVELNGVVSVETQQDMYFTPLTLHKPPTEENLMQNTLWPEIQKLYGHGYEIFCLAARSDGRVIASACKATSKEHAALLLWDTETWAQIQKLYSHSLTVTDISFSPDGTYLLSVSRDRTWSIYKLQPDNETSYELHVASNKTNGVHTRIIWCCAWSHDSSYFATGSRDGKYVVWDTLDQSDSNHPLKNIRGVTTITKKDASVTSTSFAPILIQNFYIFAIGFESGHINIYKFLDNTETLILNINSFFAHSLCVKRLAFRPIPTLVGAVTEENKVLQLASGSSDHSIKIFDIYFE